MDISCLISQFNFFRLLLRVYNKTLEYVKTFAKFNTTDSAGAVREWVSSNDTSDDPVVFLNATFTRPISLTNLFFPSWCLVLWNTLSRYRTLRREPALTQFETAQIANLCPADAEEAKSIVPRYVSTQRITVSILTSEFLDHPYLNALTRFLFIHSWNLPWCSHPWRICNAWRRPPPTMTLMAK